MTKYEEIEKIEDKKAELWEKKNKLYKEIEKINQELIEYREENGTLDWNWRNKWKDVKRTWL